MIPAFAATEEGKGVAVTTSYGASGDQSRDVEDGKPADIVNFSVEPDVTRLVKADKVAKDWNADANKGIPFGSVVSLVVREGNPKNIKDWDDLLQPGLEVVTPSPLSSGSAKWNLLAPYAAKSNGGQNHQAGLDYVTKLVTEHVKTRPGRAVKPPRCSSRAPATCCSATRTRPSTSSGRVSRSSTSTRRRRSRSRTRSPWSTPAPIWTRRTP